MTSVPVPGDVRLLAILSSCGGAARRDSRWAQIRAHRSRIFRLLVTGKLDRTVARKGCRRRCAVVYGKCQRQQQASRKRALNRKNHAAPRKTRSDGWFVADEPQKTARREQNQEDHQQEFDEYGC